MNPEVYSAETRDPDKVVMYKKVEGKALHLHIFNPEGHGVTDRRPVIVFFFGGGWVGGFPQQFYPQAAAFAKEGFVAIAAEYSTDRENPNPFQCVKDAKSAIRWIRKEAAALGVLPDKVVAAGGSAGGHLAACAAVIEGDEEDGENAQILSRPNAMILYNAVLDTTEKGYGINSVGLSRKTLISPCHHVREGCCPALLFHGTADLTVPFENAQRFSNLLNEVGSHCTLLEFEGRGHGFFNPSKSVRDFSVCMEESIIFLRGLNFLKDTEE